jgi:hypothetical protein
LQTDKTAKLINTYFQFFPDSSKDEENWLSVFYITYSASKTYFQMLSHKIFVIPKISSVDHNGPCHTNNVYLW